MADEAKRDPFSETTPQGTPAYPQVIYEETSDKYPDGKPIMKVLGTAKNSDEHRKMVKKDWGK